MKYKYKEKIVAFIDILGFKNLLDETVDKNGDDNEEKIKHIIEAYNIIRDTLGKDAVVRSSKKVSIFSDNIVISFNISDKNQLLLTLHHIQLLLMNLINNNILCRGALSIGKMIHTDDYLFGPALVDAYVLESKAALYPRIILDQSVIEAGSSNVNDLHTDREEANYIKNILGQDSDGMYYIDYFSKVYNELDEPLHDFPEYLENLGNIIRKGLQSSGHHSKGDVRVKYAWMREKYNNVVKILKNDKSYIHYLETNGYMKLVNFYKNLKPISPDRYKKDFK